MSLDRASLQPKRDPQVMEQVITVGELCLSLCDTLIINTKIDRNDKSRQAVQLCIIYFLGKIQRVTRAALTLIISGQGSEALLLSREQFDYILSFNYYKKLPDEAILFLASQVLLKKKFATDVMSFDKSAANDPARGAALVEITAHAEQAYRDFPNLRRVKGKSGTSKSPILIDWSAPCSQTMLRNLMDGWVRDDLAQKGKTLSHDDLALVLQNTVDRIYFLRSTFISQGKHGTAFDLGNAISINDDGLYSPEGHQASEPNHLAFHFIQNLMPQINDFRSYTIPERFESELAELGAAYAQLREKLGVVDEQMTF